MGLALVFEKVRRHAKALESDFNKSSYCSGAFRAYAGLAFSCISLTACLPRVLSELSAEDREATTLCDLQGMAQADYANAKGISLSAAKSRIQRARVRVKQQMTKACQVQLDASGHVEDFVPRPALK